MKLIHCSDLHLDSKMEALPPHKAKERGSEILLSFEGMVAFAKKNGVSAVMIAGDMFDTQRVSPATVSFVLDAMRRAEGIDFLYLRGNHDESRFAFAGRDRAFRLPAFWGICYTGSRLGSHSGVTLRVTFGVTLQTSLKPAWDAG